MKITKRNKVVIILKEHPDVWLTSVDISRFLHEKYGNPMNLKKISELLKSLQDVIEEEKIGRLEIVRHKNSRIINIFKYTDGNS